LAVFCNSLKRGCLKISSQDAGGPSVAIDAGCAGAVTVEIPSIGAVNVPVVIPTVLVSSVGMLLPVFARIVGGTLWG
jgi:hypothetical protein